MQSVMSRSDEAGAELAARWQGLPKARRALVVGGYANHVAGAIGKNLATVGIVVCHHWEGENTTGKKLPHDVDLIILITDVAAMSMRRHAAQLAAEHPDVGYIEVLRQWGRMSRALVQHKIIKEEALTRVPEPTNNYEPQATEAPVADSSKSPSLSIRSLPPPAPLETFAQRTEALKQLIGRLFDLDGFQSLIATRDENGDVQIDADQQVTRIEKKRL